MAEQIWQSLATECSNLKTNADLFQLNLVPLSIQEHGIGLTDHAWERQDLPTLC